MKNNILSIKNLSKSYFTKEKKVDAIQDFSFDIKVGDFIAIVGPSGCGKSTILSIIAGLEDKNSGILIKNNKLKIGYMFQTDCLLKWRTVLNNCLLPKEFNNDNCLSKEEIITLLKKYNLFDFKDSFPNTLSGGMRQRVALIRTLAINPDLLLLDEPFSALDYQSKLQITNDLHNIINDIKKTTILVTHDIKEAISLATIVIILSNRPSTIKKIIKIDFDKNMTIEEKINDKRFNQYYNLVWKEIDKYE